MERRFHRDWDMTIDEQRPYTWTSAEAADLPIFTGLARYDEVAAGAIKHALRFTVPSTRRAFTLPASHWASSQSGRCVAAPLRSTPNQPQRIPCTRQIGTGGRPRA